MSETSIQTWTGTFFDPFDRTTWQFDRLDIARALSNICRFAGHIEPRSVAQHSLDVAGRLDGKGKRVQLLGLLHDASEAYLLDIPRPWKPHVSFGNMRYCDLEDQVQMAIFEWAGVLDLYHGQAWIDVKAADMASYEWEELVRGENLIVDEHPDDVMNYFLNAWDHFDVPKQLPAPKLTDARMARAMRCGLPAGGPIKLPAPDGGQRIDSIYRSGQRVGPPPAPGMEKVHCISTPSRMWGTNPDKHTPKDDFDLDWTHSDV